MKENETSVLLCKILNHRWYGKLALVKAILENGANPNEPCSFLMGRTAVHLAAENESSAGLEILKLLLKKTVTQMPLTSGNEFLFIVQHKTNLMQRLKW